MVPARPRRGVLADLHARSRLRSQPECRHCSRCHGDRGTSGRRAAFGNFQRGFRQPAARDRSPARGVYQWTRGRVRARIFTREAVAERASADGFTADSPSLGPAGRPRGEFTLQPYDCAAIAQRRCQAHSYCFDTVARPSAAGCSARRAPPRSSVCRPAARSADGRAPGGSLPWRPRQKGIKLRARPQKRPQ